MRYALHPADTQHIAHVAVMAIMLSLGAACAPIRPVPGDLTPLADRTTNEIRAVDLATIDAWEARRMTMLRAEGVDLPAYSVVLARAGAWIAFARDTYVSHPSSLVADEALAEARRLLDSLRCGGAVNTSAMTQGALATAAQRLSPDLWKRLRELQARPESTSSVSKLAEAEIELVRAATLSGPASDRTVAPVTPFAVALAGAPMDAPPALPASIVSLPANVSSASISRLACPQVQHVVRAGRLLLEADAGPRAAPPRVSALDDVTARARPVHFAVSSARLSPLSASLLSGVAEAMRAHAELSLVIEGHADPRGTTMSNLFLSGRRAFTVRDLLIDDGVDGGRVMVRMFGSTRRAATGTSSIDYARDRRVQLKFLLPDGSELPITTDLSDLQIEQQRLWVGSMRPGVRRRVAPPAEPATERSREMPVSRHTKKVKR